MIVDLHVHTKLSADSNVAAEAYATLAARRHPALGAICFTEHRRYPTDAETDREYAELQERFGLLIFKGIEADTDLGHLLVLGITPELRRRFNLEDRMIRAERLIEFVHGDGGIAIPAHPFRDSGYGTRLDGLLAKLGPSLNTVEALNGQNSTEEDAAALAACEKLGLNAVGGSDAHFATPQWFMTCATELERNVATVAELCAELRDGRARPYRFPREINPSGATPERA
jgi:histidinol phosphatase-like PHP family hydrolase